MCIRDRFKTAAELQALILLHDLRLEEFLDDHGLVQPEDKYSCNNCATRGCIAPFTSLISDARCYFCHARKPRVAGDGVGSYERTMVAVRAPPQLAEQFHQEVPFGMLETADDY